MKSDRRGKIIIGSIIGLAAAVVVVPLVVFLVSLISDNGNKIIIDNYDAVVSDVPGYMKKDVFESLYNIVQGNVEAAELIPESGAMIREGSWDQEYNQSQNMHFFSFIVDIASLEQSYRGLFKWSDDRNNPYFYGNNGGFGCVEYNERIYENFVCESSYSDAPMIRFPITNKLPLTVEYYSDNYSKYTKYELKYRVGEDKLTIIVTDYAGGAYEKALNTIRELGFNPDDYEIEYTDISKENTWVHVGN